MSDWLWSATVRCPICREPFERTEEAFDAHMKTHTTVEMIRAGWRDFPLYTAGAAAAAMLLVIFAIAVYMQAMR